MSTKVNPVKIGLIVGLSFILVPPLLFLIPAVAIPIIALTTALAIPAILILGPVILLGFILGYLFGAIWNFLNKED